MTLMVRDEADIIGPMINHHLSQGIDKIIATDNGSIDGTYDILRSYGDAIDLRLDPVQRKQQFSVVTKMARDAFEQYEADWVLNADADEFWLPATAAQPLRELFEEIPTSLRTFRTPVVDMTGAPALRGTGLQRLTLRDTRPRDRLHEIGLYSHSTPDAVHVGRSDIEVAQGNHSVNLTQDGALPDGLEIEVLHLPWRSWEQFETKVRNSGLAYESNPELLPSPNHHGMREYRRWKQGTLQAFYVLRHPGAEETAAALERGELQTDLRLAETLVNSVPDEEFATEAIGSARRYGAIFTNIENEHRRVERERNEREAELLRYIDEGKQRIDALIEELNTARAIEQELQDRIDATIEAQLSRLVSRTRRALRRG